MLYFLSLYPSLYSKPYWQVCIKSLWWYKPFLTTNILVFNITMSLMMDGILILKQTLLFQAHSSPQIIEFKVDLHPSYPFWHSNSWINRVQKWFWTSSFCFHLNRVQKWYWTSDISHGLWINPHSLYFLSFGIGNAV